MLVVSVRMKYLKIATAVVLVIVIIAMIFLAFLGSKSKNDNSANVISTKEDRIVYLNKCGWVVNETELEVKDVIIPSNFNNVYSNYNKLQLKQGYDLSKYKGVTVKKYTYEVVNYPNVVENIRANVLIYKDRVIGGDITNLEPNGTTECLVTQR